MPSPSREGSIIKWAAVSVCPSVCLVPQHNSRREMPRKPKIGRMKAHHKSNPWTYLEVKRSKVEVTEPINAYTVNSQYLPKGRKAYELQTWYTDGVRRPVSPTSDMIFKVIGQGRKITWYIWQVLAHKSSFECPRNTKIGRNIAHPTGTNAHYFQGQRSKSPIRLICASGKGVWRAIVRELARTRLVAYITHNSPFLPQQWSRPSPVVTAPTRVPVKEWPGWVGWLNTKMAYHHLLPPVKSLPMQLRPGRHNCELPVCKYTIFKRSFITRCLFGDDD